jgi:DNA polymerase-3 subunit delta'
MFFREIVGQELLKNRLIQTVKENRVSHAWLFFGPEGTGSLPLALAYAGYILCTNRTETEACGVCPSCRKTQKYIHPDLHFLFPVNKTRDTEGENATCDDFLADWRNFLLYNPYGRINQWYNQIDLENKQGNINTDESKRLASKLFLKPFESDYKIAIIWQADKMNDQASNKILKLLEEPPPMTIFILITENPDSLLPTIRSRCIPVKVPRIPDEDILNHLTSVHSIEKENALEITRLAQGNYLKAKEMITDSEDFNYFFTKFRDLMRSCLRSNIPELIKHAEELAGLNRERQKTFLEYGLSTIRESVALHFGEPALVHISSGEMEFTPKFAPFITGYNTAAFTEELTRASRDIERNGNGKIIFLDLVLKLAGLIKR